MTTVLPALGQLVDVRQRRFVVMEISKSALPPDPLNPRANGQQHLITLSSVEDDALGEELQVVWELEPGARVLEKASLPEPNGFDEPRRLDAFLDAVRWGAISSANVRSLQAPFRSGIDIEDYQLSISKIQLEDDIITTHPTDRGRRRSPTRGRAGSLSQAQSAPARTGFASLQPGLEHGDHSLIHWTQLPERRARPRPLARAGD